MNTKPRPWELRRAAHRGTLWSLVAMVAAAVAIASLVCFADAGRLAALDSPAAQPIGVRMLFGLLGLAAAVLAAVGVVRTRRS